MKLGITIFAATAGFIAIFAVAQSYAEPESFTDSAEIIVVLGGGMDPDGTLYEPSKLRVIKAVELYQAGAAPKMLFSGGRALDAGPSAADLMAKLAVRLGVPPSAILTETRALSTLQNALFSMPALEGSNDIILITEGFHLLRAWLSFQWAAQISGRTLHISLAHSAVFDPQTGAKLLVTETLSIWFNLGRVAAWYGGSWLNIPLEIRDNWLS